MSYPLWQNFAQMNINSEQERQANSLVINTEDGSLEMADRRPDTKSTLESEAWPDPVPGHLLLCDIAKLLRRFVVLPKWAEETLALWILHTYAFHLREVTTY